MVNEIVPVDQDYAQAQLLVKSKFFPETEAEQAYAKILAGRELGIGPIQALTKINVIQGKISIPPEMMLSLCIRNVKGFRHKIVESTNEKCSIQFQREGFEEYVHTFTIEDAKRLGLATRDQWIKQPGTMLRWRCFSGGIRVYCPDGIGGAYLQEEMEAVEPKKIPAKVSPAAKSETRAWSSPEEKGPRKAEEEPPLKPEDFPDVGLKEEPSYMKEIRKEKKL